MSSGRLLKPLDLSSDKPPCSASAAQQAAGLSAKRQWSWSYPPTGKFAAARALIPCIWNLHCVWYDVLQFRFLSRWCASTKNENLCKYMMNSPPIVPRTCHERTAFHLVLSRLRETHPTTKYGNGKIPASGKMHSPPFRAPATNYLLSCLRVSQNQPTREVRQRGNARLRQVHSLSIVPRTCHKTIFHLVSTCLENQP